MNVIKFEQPLITKSRVAILGTLAELHQAPITYNLKTVRRLVNEIQPDLLCAEISLSDWQTGDLSTMPPEYRDTLLPLAQRTNIIIVPVGGSNKHELVAPRGQRWLCLRTGIVRVLNWQLKLMQRLANEPRTINSGPFGLLCNGMCALTAWVCGPEARLAWDENNRTILENILTSIRRDPGCRVLVTVDCRRFRRLKQSLHNVPEIELVDYQQL